MNGPVKDDWHASLWDTGDCHEIPEDKIIVRCYCGGYDQAEERAILGAISDLQLGNIDLQRLYIADMRKKHFTVDMFVDWLRQSDIHIIVCYPHEGMEDQGWDLVYLEHQLQNLRYHVGSPYSIHLKDPFFCRISISISRRLAHWPIRH